MEEAKIVRCFKKEREPVRVGEALLEIETEKAGSEIESPVAGFVKKVIAVEGKQVEVESVLAYLVEKEDELQAELVLPAADAVSKSSQVGNRMQEVAITSDSNPTGATVDSASEAKEIRAALAACKLARDLRVDLFEVKGTGPSGRILPQDVRNTFEQRADVQRATAGRSDAHYDPC
jgi:pyruvate dehydrogenase E2 component (dihydrolipoamide acetyltransferase)